MSDEKKMEERAKFSEWWRANELYGAEIRSYCWMAWLARSIEPAAPPPASTNRLTDELIADAIDVADALEAFGADKSPADIRNKAAKVIRAIIAATEQPADDSGMAGPAMVEHEFVLQPSSSIELCRYCGIGKVAARGNTICDVATTEQS